MQYVLGGRKECVAGDELGATCFLLVITVCGRTWRILVDCGLEPTAVYPGWRSINLAHLAGVLNGEKLDFVFITHAHLDHCGFLPALLPFFDEKTTIVTSATTARLLLHVLCDAFELAVRRTGGGPTEDKPFQLMDLIRLFHRCRWERMERPGVLKLGDGLDVLVWPAGHIHGACSLVFRVSERGVMRKLMLMGDYAVHDQVLIPGAPLLPSDWLLTGPDDAVAWFDGTNGGEDLKPWHESLEDVIRRAANVAREGRAWIGVTFSLVRWQLLIHEFGKRIPRNGVTPVLYADGPSAQRIAKILSASSWWGEQPFDLSAAEMVNGRERGKLLAAIAGKRILTPSGMGHGPATSYLVQCLDDPNVCIEFTGFVAKGTNGDAALRAREGDVITLPDAEIKNGEPAKIRVRAERVQSRLSGHLFRRDGIARVGALFGVDSAHCAAWLRKQDGTPFASTVSSRERRRSVQEKILLAHGSVVALDWYEKQFSPWLTVRRYDSDEDRAMEF